MNFASEIGAQVLRPDGTVFVAGDTGHTGVYNVAANTWVAGPDFPLTGKGQVVSGDAPAALLPSGNVLIAASQSLSFEFDGNPFNPVVTSDLCSALLLLPTGQVLCTGYSSLHIYTPSGNPDRSWAPTIATAPSTVKPGLTYAITGTQFNGLSQAVALGDDYQGATNYPLVRITNTASGHVFYARTHDHSTMALRRDPRQCPLNSTSRRPSKSAPRLVVVANGIPSKPVNLSVSLTASDPLSSKNSASYAANSLAADSIAFFEAPNIASALVVSSDNPWPATLGGAHLDLTDSQGQTRAVPLYFVTTTSMGGLIPADTALGPATIKLTTSAGADASGTMTIERISPGLFTANASGSGVPAGFWIRAAAGGTQTQDYLFDPAQPVGSRVPVAVDLGALTIKCSFRSTAPDSAARHRLRRRLEGWMSKWPGLPPSAFIRVRCGKHRTAAARARRARDRQRGRQFRR